jgi:multidrug resistance efflux pump
VRRAAHPKENAVENREEHVGKMETRLKNWGAKLDELTAKAEKADADVMVDYHKRLDDLKAKCLVAQSKLEALRVSEGEKWETFKNDVDVAWTELETAFQKLVN